MLSVNSDLSRCCCGAAVAQDLVSATRQLNTSITDLSLHAYGSTSISRPEFLCSLAVLNSRQQPCADFKLLSCTFETLSGRTCATQICNECTFVDSHRAVVVGNAQCREVSRCSTVLCADVPHIDRQLLYQISVTLRASISTKSYCLPLLNYPTRAATW